MNLKLRLNLVTTSLLLLLMLAGITLSFNNARNNTLAEIASAEKSTLYLFENAMLAINPNNPQQVDLNSFKLQQLNHMRHLKIELVDSQGSVLDSNQRQSLNKISNEAPAWFEQLLNKTCRAGSPK